MERTRVPFTFQLDKTLALLSNPGLLLASTKRSGASNVMTIGWGTVGIIWGRPCFVVLVRPSRYTYEFIEDSKVFTVNVPTEALREWVGFCGSRSGRQVDKFSAYGISVSRGQTVEAITIDPCPMVYECRVIHYNDVIPSHLDPAVEAASYGGKDYHRLYYGEILGVFAAQGA
ncbi:MAG: flavin reductase family protein [Chloroflexi bacterium]|nr:flavin reductase family protein [Chloroflexota bacterium]